MTNQELTQAREQMVQDMLNQAARWRALPGKNGGRVVFVDADQRLMWLVEGVGYVGMQISPTTGRPLVLSTCGLGQEQLDGALLAYDLCRSDLLNHFKPQEFGHYCELAAKGCESAAQFMQEVIDTLQ